MSPIESGSRTAGPKTKPDLGPGSAGVDETTDITDEPADIDDADPENESVESIEQDEDAPPPVFDD